MSRKPFLQMFVLIGLLLFAAGARRTNQGAAALTTTSWNFQVVAQTGNGLNSLVYAHVTNNGEVYFSANFVDAPWVRVLAWANGQATAVPLPGGAAFSDPGAGMFLNPDGELVFRGTCEEKLGSTCILRANNTVERIDTGSYISNVLVPNNGYWLLTEPLGNSTTRVAATNGTIQTPAVTIVTNLQNSERYEVRYIVDVAPDGAVLIYEFIFADGINTTRLKFVGARDEVVVQKEQVAATSVGEYLEVPAGVNSFGDVLYSLTTYTENLGGGVNSHQSLHIWPASGGGGGKMLEQNASFRSFAWPMTLGDNYRPVFKAWNIACEEDDRAVTLECNPYFVGFNLPADMFTVPCEELFGQGCNLHGAPQLSENGEYLLARVNLANGGQALVLAGEDTTVRWTNPAGGAWGEGDNWTPTGVPTETAEVAFDLTGSYAVNLGTRRIGGILIEDGDVTFRNGELEVAPLNLAISGFNPGNAPRLTIGETGVPISNTTLVANITVGSGELKIQNSQVSAPNQVSLPGTVELGVTGPATVTVSHGAIWQWQHMYVGILDRTHLRIEKGAFVGGATPAEKMVIGASSLPNAKTASVIVDDAGNDPGPFNLGTTLGASILDLIIGQGLVGSLEVKNGGSVYAVTTTLGTVDHGAMTDATLVVSGRNATRPSTFSGGNDVLNNGGLFAAVAQGSDAHIEVVDGGLMLLTFLSLADGPQSSALMFVDGENGGEKSRLQAPLPATGSPQNPNPAAGLCVVGRRGSGVLNLSNGGLAECLNIYVGFEPGSRGEINLGAGSKATAWGTLNGDGLICIGSVAACGSTGTQGVVNILSGGILVGENILIGRNGQIRGSGTVFAVHSVQLLGGKIAPGIQQLIPGTRSTGAALTIEGDLTVDESGEIVLDLFGAAADLQDTLVVTGTLDMNGRLVLNFGNGYAPTANDEWILIQAGAYTGTPSEVVISGLKPGFEYELEFSGGALKMTALNDGVSEPEQNLIYLPLVSRQ